MGTRHLTCVFEGDRFKVAQYGQWDGYPSATGVAILKFIQEGGVERLKGKLDQVEFMTNEDYERIYGESDLPKDGFLSKDQVEKYNKLFPYLSRDIGSDILGLISEAEGPVYLTDSSSFAGDGLFCEFAWVINLDENVLQMYVGFVKEGPVDKGVFSNVPLDEQDNEYRPVDLRMQWNLDHLKTCGQTSWLKEANEAAGQEA